MNEERRFHFISARRGDSGRGARVRCRFYESLEI